LGRAEMQCILDKQRGLSTDCTCSGAMFESMQARCTSQTAEFQNIYSDYCEISRSDEVEILNGSRAIVANFSKQAYRATLGHAHRVGSECRWHTEQ
jgi:hypothetical protein